MQQLLTLGGTLHQSMTARKWMISLRNTWPSCPLKPDVRDFFRHTTGCLSLQPFHAQILWQLATHVELACAQQGGDMDESRDVRISYSAADELMHVVDPNLNAKLFNYMSASVAESVKHLTMSIAIDKVPAPGQALCNGCIVWPNNVGAIAAPQVRVYNVYVYGRMDGEGARTVDFSFICVKLGLSEGWGSLTAKRSL